MLSEAIWHARVVRTSPDPTFVPVGRDAEAAATLAAIQSGESPADVAASLLQQRLVPMDVYKILRSAGLSYPDAQAATEAAVEAR